MGRDYAVPDAWWLWVLGAASSRDPHAGGRSEGRGVDELLAELVKSVEVPGCEPLLVIFLQVQVVAIPLFYLAGTSGSILTSRGLSGHGAGHALGGADWSPISCRSCWGST